MRPGVSLATASNEMALPGTLLVAIGCDVYASIGNLSSAETDAERIFGALTTGPAALYNPETSVLLRSPRRSEIDECFRYVLEQHRGLATLTVYFAGHGELFDGSLYLCPSDTSLDAISVTTINISQILRTICELRPQHAYLIIDACFSGGVALDLTSVLRSEILDRAPGFGLSILASASMTNVAKETPAGGIFTAELLRVLDGQVLVGETQPTLGLGEIVRKLQLNDPLKEQRPNLWDLNLLGPDTFCRNPAFRANVTTETQFGTLQYQSQRAVLSDDLARQLWGTFLGLPQHDPEALSDLFRRVVKEQAGSTSLPDATLAIARSFAVALEDSEDTFAPVLVYAAMVRALMPCADAPRTRAAMRAHLLEVCSTIKRALDELATKLGERPYHLLGRGGLSDLYFLPLRLSKILGWISFLMRASPQLGVAPSSLNGLRPLTRNLLAQYGNSVVAVGDDQASGFLLFLGQCHAAGWTEEAEEVVGRLYNDFNEHFGRVLINDPSASDIVDYLILKAERPIEADVQFVQNPSELFSVVLVGAAMLNLDDDIDLSLIEIDHTSFSFYVPSSYREFWRTDMEQGSTIVFQLGHGLKAGHGIWTVNDMHRAWCQDIALRVSSAAGRCDELDLIAAALMSIVIPDRLAWFAVPSMASRSTIPWPEPDLT